MSKIELNPIGFVEKEGDLSKIVVYERYADALERIESFNCLIILYWLHRVDERDRYILKIKPKFKDVPALGIFATRFPARPNPIGLTTVELIKRDDNVLIVRGLDAEDGTPVIDIKPFIPLFDTPKVDVKLPPWILRHMKKHERGKHEHSYDEILRRVEIVKRCD
jgi:tRNA-Thr(GGU) m(6)t(6)A37 methyltransferase TsaA